MSTDELYPEESAWLVEMNDNGPKYWTCVSFGDDGDEWPWGGFDHDVNKALRFAREKDANDFIAAHGWTPGHVFASEHMWGGEKIEHSASKFAPQSEQQD